MYCITSVISKLPLVSTGTACQFCMEEEVVNMVKDWKIDWDLALLQKTGRT